MQKLRKILSIYVVSHADNYSAPIGERSIMRSVSVCVCRRSYLRNYTSFWACYLWPFRLGPPLAAYSDMLRISGFMNDVIFAHKLRLLDVATRLRQRGSQKASGLARRNTRCRQRTLGTTSCSQGLLGCR